MLKSYEATIENCQIRWLNEQPQVSNVRIIITVLAEENTLSKTGESPITTVLLGRQSKTIDGGVQENLELESPITGLMEFVMN